MENPEKLWLPDMPAVKKIVAFQERLHAKTIERLMKNVIVKKVRNLLGRVEPDDMHMRLVIDPICIQEAEEEPEDEFIDQDDTIVRPVYEIEFELRPACHDFRNDDMNISAPIRIASGVTAEIIASLGKSHRKTAANMLIAAFADHRSYLREFLEDNNETSSGLVCIEDIGDRAVIGEITSLMNVRHQIISKKFGILPDVPFIERQDLIAKAFPQLRPKKNYKPRRAGERTENE